MKRKARIISVCWAGLLLMSLSAGAARGNVTVLDSQYHVSGWFTYYLYPGFPDPGTEIPIVMEYDYTSNSPVSGAVSHGYAHAVSGAITSQVSAYADVDWNAPLSLAEAEYVTTFRPWDSDLSITFTYESTEHGQDPVITWADVSLKDLTSGTTLIDSGSWGTGLFGHGASETSPYPTDGSWPWSPYWERYDLTVDPTHIYQLRLRAEAAGNLAYIPGGRVTVASSIPPVPAPGAILLGTLGAGLVGWLRQRRTL